MLCTFIGSYLFSILISSAITFKVSEAIKDMQLRIPPAVCAGKSVTFICDYDLELVALYTVKWYRYDEEFYRYVPKESPPSRVFPMKHINVDLSKSNEKNVTLTTVDRETEGLFKCEVSSDAPLFHTEIRQAFMMVADVPKDPPELLIEIKKVAPGRRVQLNCSSPGSYPKMNLTWLINGIEEQPKSGYYVAASVLQFNPDKDQYVTRSSVDIRTTQSMFKNGKMKITCIATLYDLYKRSISSEILEDTPLLAHIMGPSGNRKPGIQNGYGKILLSNVLILFTVVLQFRARHY